MMREKFGILILKGRGRKEIKKLERAFEIVAILDNDKSKSGITYNGIFVFHMEEAEELLKYCIIVRA